MAIGGVLTLPLMHRVAQGAVPFNSIAQSFRIASAEPNFIRPHAACPDQLEELITLLLRDLPSYANRVTQRAYIEAFRLTANLPGTIILAGHPDYQPIELTAREYLPHQDDTTSQVFFTTLERQYVSNKVVDLQHYYWLFLTQTESGWRLVLLFSSLGQTPPGQPPTPPQDASQGVIARAIRLWLRDCQAGSIN
jgi:hypothetical protein